MKHAPRFDFSEPKGGKSWFTPENHNRRDYGRRMFHYLHAVVQAEGEDRARR